MNRLWLPNNCDNNFLPSGGAQYGIFLNTFGASVFTYNLIWIQTFIVVKRNLSNVQIYGMSNII